MKFSLPIFGLVCLTFFSASAQVTVDVVLDQEQFLPSETMPVAVRITNRSGQPLHLGADANWLTFSVESTGGTVVVKKPTCRCRVNLIWVRRKWPPCVWIWRRILC